MVHRDSLRYLVARQVVVGRYYDPQTGQFLSVDSKVQQTLEAYLYVGDDPVNGTDPSGATAIVGTEWESPDMRCRVDCGGWNLIRDLRHIGDSIGHWVVKNAGTISTVLSVLSVIAFLACPETGVACVAAEVISKVGSGIDLAAAVHTCKREGVDANCRLAAAAFGLDLLMSGVGREVNNSWKVAITEKNLAKNATLYIGRQQQVIGATLGSLSAAASVFANK
ncbi:MAG: RHS repeat-associated core domain-containing protein [Acidimicrobiales bacterium]|jgi:hypothetical protein